MKKTFLKRIKYWWCKFKWHISFPDPVKHCETYLKEGCSHVDGPGCNFPRCDFQSHIKQKYFYEDICNEDN